MKALSAFAAAIAASLALYLLVFAFVQRPLTVGDVPRLLQAKTAYSRTLPSPKLVIFAGSNGRYSHRCAPMSEATSLPCVNLSLAVGVGLDYQFQRIEPLLQPGDLVYLPLEFSQYRVERDEMEGGAENAVLVHDDRTALWQLPPRRIARALGSFDLSFLLQGLVEMALAQTGFQRRTGLDTLTQQGDEKDHSASAGQAYAASLRQLRFDARPLPLRSHAIDVIAGFLDRCRERRIQVIGGLPTTPEGVVLDPAEIQRLRALYENHGQRWLQLPNRSQYPLACFYDTLYHLNEGCQIAHSARLGRAVAGLQR